jgi:glutaminyl-tRNA synthetase
MLLDLKRPLYFDVEDIRRYRGTLTSPGMDSPYRSRDHQENINLFQAMLDGRANENNHKRVARLKIDNRHPSMLMRDPIIYRCKSPAGHTPPSRDADEQESRMYPMYDFAQCLCDALNGVTHSLCTTEFIENRQLYDHILGLVVPSGLLTAALGDNPHLPRQMEFSRLQFVAEENIHLSKRKIQSLLGEGAVTGWDDMNLYTLKGLRRRGVSARALKMFAQTVGVSASTDGAIETFTFDESIREDLHNGTHRAFAVLEPLPAIITNWDDHRVENLSVGSHPTNTDISVHRELPFGKHLVIDRSDFQDSSSDEIIGDRNSGGRKGVSTEFYGLTLGGFVRLKGAFMIRCDKINRDHTTNALISIECTVFEESRGGKLPAILSSESTERPQAKIKKPKGIIHWLSAPHAQRGHVMLLQRQQLNKVGKVEGVLNQRATSFPDAYIEHNIDQLCPVRGDIVQFERIGYFARDDDRSACDPSSGGARFHCVVPLLQRLKK